MSDEIINETERQLAQHHCRKAFRYGASLDEICIVPKRYGLHGKSAWMKEAARIIDEELGRNARIEAERQEVAA
jgi:hypothetical protein